MTDWFDWFQPVHTGQTGPTGQTGYATTIGTFYNDYNKPSDVDTLVVCLVDYITHYFYASKAADYADPLFDVARFVLCDTQSVEAKPFNLYFQSLIYDLQSANIKNAAFSQLLGQAAQNQIFNQTDQTHQTGKHHAKHAKHHSKHVQDDNYIDFYPRASVDNNTITLRFLVNNNVGQNPSQQDAQMWLDTFYQDSLGRYVARQADFTQPVFTSLPASIVVSGPVLTKQMYNNTSVQLGWVASIKIKIGFVCLVHQLLVQPDVFNALAANWQDHTVGVSTPKPSSQAFAMTCQVDAKHPTGVCDCAYFATYQSVDCPASQLYFCQYTQQCLCVVSRVMPWSLNLNQRINAKFAQCFDLACQNRPSDCSDAELCQSAQQWLSGPNWFEGIINPGGLDVLAVRQACNIQVAQVPKSVNQFFIRWYQIVGLAGPVVGFCVAWLVQKSINWRSVVMLVLLVAVLAVLVYASSGVQLCKAFGQANQAGCYDRLSQTVQLSRADCADQAIMCQCNSADQAQQLCTDLALNNCRCQNDQTCQPATGEAANFMAVAPAEQRVRLQVVLACCGAFLLCSPICWAVLKRHNAPTWMIAVCVVVLAILVVGLPIGLTANQTMRVVQTSVQQAAC